MTSDELAEKLQTGYEAVQSLEEFDGEFLEVVEVYHERTGHEVDDDTPWPAVMVHMVVRMVPSPVYTYPAIEAGREEGLELFDTVSYFHNGRYRDEGDVKIRFRVP